MTQIGEGSTALQATDDVGGALAGEPARAYDGWCRYRDLGPRRSLGQAAEAVYGAAVTAAQRRTIERWSARWRWVDRAAGWDREQDRLRREVMRDELIAMSKRHVEIANAAQAKLVRRLSSINPDDLSPAEWARWFDLTVRVEREARGLSGARVEIDHRGEVEHSLTGGEITRRVLATEEGRRLAYRLLDVLADDDGEATASASPEPSGPSDTVVA